MYPDYKVFIDPRYGPYWKEVGPDYFELLENMNVESLKKFTSKYPFKIVLLHMRDWNLIFLFLSLPEWRLLYFDKTAVVIAHKSVIPQLRQEALSTDMGTQRFRDVTNPRILDDLFGFYINVDPVPAREILDIYKNNVSVFFRFKGLKILEMENIIKLKER
jgi:hypothetical protein